MFRICCILIGYALGCIQTAYITGKVVAGIDVRQHGSGNAGTTNVTRVVGRAAGLTVFICDVLKAMIAYALCTYIFGGSGSFLIGATSHLGGFDVLPGLYAGLGVVLGHNFPFFLKFKGGKGIASTLGIVLMLDWRIALIVYAAGFVAIVSTSYISLGSLVMTVLTPVLMMLFGHIPEAVGIGGILTALAYIQHRGNIKRLLSGTERKTSLRKKK